MTSCLIWIRWSLLSSSSAYWWFSNILYIVISKYTCWFHLNFYRFAMVQLLLVSRFKLLVLKSVHVKPTYVLVLYLPGMCVCVCVCVYVCVCVCVYVYICHCYLIYYTAKMIHTKICQHVIQRECILFNTWSLII